LKVADLIWPTEVITEDVRAAGPSVAVVVPCRDEEQHIETVLESIRQQDLPAGEVVLVDGGSSDRTMEVVAGYAARHPDFPLKTVSVHGANIAAALNAGIAAATADVIVRMDAHSLPARDYVRCAVAALIETGAAVAGGVWHIVPGAPNGVAMAIAKAVAHPMGAGDAAYRTASGLPPERRAVDTVPFGCFSKSHWLRVGGYNEELLANEDYEFNYRTLMSGGRVILDTAVQCQYFARTNFAKLARQYFRYGWWKGRMLRQHPASLRWRQTVAALFLPAWAAAIAAVVSLPALAPAGIALALAYTGAVLAAAVQAVRRDWNLVPATAAAFVTIHTAWSAGISSFFLTGATATDRRHPGARRARAGLNGAQLVLALVVIGILAFVFPPLMAERVHARRIVRAHRDSQRIAAAVAEIAEPRVPVGVYVGAGAEPRFASDSGWQQRTVTVAGGRFAAQIPADPWGNHYLIVTGGGAGKPGPAWVLSAGPNGIVETRFSVRPPRVTAGDDIVARAP
jgi:succinoglycan biosynthesis protein ExoA